MDRLLRLLGEAGFFTKAYADDVIIITIADDQEIDKASSRTETVRKGNKGFKEG